MQEAIKLLSQDRNISFEWISNPSFFREMTSSFCTVKPQKPLLLIQKLSPGLAWTQRWEICITSRNSIGSGGSDVQRTELQALVKSCLGTQAPLPAQVTPGTRWAHSQVPTNPAMPFPVFCVSLSSPLPQNASNPSTAGLHTRTQKPNSNSPQCW